MDIFDQYGVQHAPIPPYHAQADPVERANGTLKTLISMYMKADHREWDVYIHEYRHALNTTMQSTTKVSPASSMRREVENSRGLQLIERVDPEA